MIRMTNGKIAMNDLRGKRTRFGRRRRHVFRGRLREAYAHVAKAVHERGIQGITLDLELGTPSVLVLVFFGGNCRGSIQYQRRRPIL